MCYVFQNRLDFKKKIDGDLIEKMRCVKRQSVIEFGDYNIATTVYALDINYKTTVSNTTNEIRYFLEQNNTLRENFFK